MMNNNNLFDATFGITFSVTKEAALRITGAANDGSRSHQYSLPEKATRDYGVVRVVETADTYEVGVKTDYLVDVAFYGAKYSKKLVKIMHLYMDLFSEYMEDLKIPMKKYEPELMHDNDLGAAKVKEEPAKGKPLTKKELEVRLRAKGCDMDIDDLIQILNNYKKAEEK